MTRNYPRWNHILTVPLLLILLLGMLAGCGGGPGFGSSATHTTGRATLTITWPTRLSAPSRLIPDAANSIKVEIKNGSASVTAQLLPRPTSGQTSSVTFASLPLGNLSVTATAYPQSDGSGTAQATATVPLVIAANQNTPFSLTLGSTIDHLEVTPSSATVQVGQSLALTVTAKDATGAIVLLSPAKLQWSAANATASIDANGNLSGLSSGTTAFTVTEQESGKSATVNVSVLNASTSTPITITSAGFNRDVIFEAASTTTATTFDDATTAWIENGLNSRAGLPSGVFTSRLPNPVTSGATQYQLQSFTGNNVLLLTDANTQGILTLSVASRFRALSIAAASSNGRFVAGVGTLTLNFTDGSSSGVINYNARDWWGEGANNDPNRIFASGLYRSANVGAGLPAASVQIDTVFTGYNLYETTIDLSNINGVDYSHRLLQSVTFNRAANVERTGIFAMSGVAAGP